MSELDRAANPTIEEAIKYLEGMIFTQDFHPSTLRAKAANTMAIEALREQAERSKGCEWCTGALPEDITPHREFFKNMLKGWSEDWLCVAKKVPSGEHILHCETDTALTDFSVDIPIRFCPMCGKRLEVEP